MDEILKILGYRLYAEKVTITQTSQKNLNVSLNITNSGIAPIYEETQLALSVYDMDGNLITKSVSSDFDARAILPNEVQKTNITIDASSLQKQNYYLCMSLEDKDSGEPSVELPMEKYKEKVYKIGQFSWWNYL